MPNPVETSKRKFDGTNKPTWYGDLVAGEDDRWLVVYYDRPPHEIGGQAVVHALRYFSLELPLSILVSFDALGSVIEFQCDAGLPATIDGRRIGIR